MSVYGWVLILSVVFPIIFSFHRKIKFFKDWGRALAAGVAVAIPFWIWDAAATKRGDWEFNDKYVGLNRIAGMPIEEILFFLVIPFCCLFIWKIINKNSKTRELKTNNTGEIILAIALVGLGLILRDKFYTSTIIWWSAATLLMTVILKSDIFKQLNYWKWIAITFIPFLIVNGVLTYLPVVMYSKEAILGIRLGTIPVEDFIYSWSLLTLNLIIYQNLNTRNQKK